MTDDYAELREALRERVHDVEFDLAVIAALLADRDQLAEALRGLLAAAEHTHAMNRVTAALDAGMNGARAALRGSGAAEEAGRG